ncbi:hypothetical protein [Roseimarinus sediminis]|uniref:hypothetical protein n=1 Tax=Roseimarinus sediminis TaxID=1610899 RepID=UPI003D1ADD0B
MTAKQVLIQLLTVSILLISLPRHMLAQKTCERMVVCKEISLPPFLSDSLFKQASTCYVNYLILNSVGSNEFFRLRIVSEKGIQASEATQADYLVSGSMSYLRGRYNIELKLTASKGQLIASGRSSFTKAEEVCEAAGAAAQSIGNGEAGNSPLISVITDFEKQARELESGLALCPSMRFIDSAPTVQLKPFERKQLKIEVSDADGVKIKGMKIQVKCSEGTLVQGTVISDKEGIATIDFFGPMEEKEYRLGAVGEVTYASRRTGQIDPEPFDILVKVKEPITRLKASIVVNEFIESKTEDSFREYHSKGRSTYTNELTLNIARGRIEYLQKPENWSNIMNTKLEYEILTGLTSKNDNGEPVPIKATGISEDKSIENGKTRLESRSNLQAETNGWDIYLAIHPYDPMSNTEHLVSLSRNYVLTLEGVGNIRMHTQPEKYGSKGRVSGVRRNSEEELESFNEEGKTGAPGFNYLKREQFDSRKVVPLEIPDPDGLEKYFLNPQGTYTLTLRGSFYSEDIGYDYFTEEVEVVVTMSPDDAE